MKKLLSLSLLLVLSLPFACTRDWDDTRTDGVRQKPTMSNTDLQNQIRAKLDSDPQLRDSNLTVTADSSRNMATLSGTVESETLKSKAVQLAREAHAGLNIEDRIEVRSSDQIYR